MKSLPRSKHCSRKSEPPLKPLFALAVLLFGLVSCTTPFVPYTGENAGKVRVRMLNDGPFVQVVPVFQQVVAGQCGARTVLPTLRPPMPTTGVQNETLAGRELPPPVANPRVDMHGSTDALNTKIAELRLPAGRYLVTLFGILGTSNCRSSGMLEVVAGEQYDMDLSIGIAACVSTLRRLEKPTQANGQLSWKAQSFEPAQAC
jgi:hypothetical protein